MDNNQSKNKKNAFIYGIIAVIVLAIIVGIVFANKGGDYYKTGVIVPLSGSGSTYGESYVKGFKKGIKEINKNDGINGTKIKLFVEDGKLGGKKTTDAANYLVNLKKVDTINTIYQAPAEAMAPILKSNQVPFIYSAYSRAITKRNPYAFKASFDAKNGCKKLVEFAKQKKNYNKLGVVLPHLPYSESCISGIKKAETNFEEYRYTFGEEDYSTILTKANKDGVDTILTIAIKPEGVRLFKKLTELDYNIDVICPMTTECIYPDVVDSASPEVLNGTLSRTYLPPNLDKTSFVQEMLQKESINKDEFDVNWMAVGYDHTKILKKALKSCEPGDRECIKKELHKVKDYDSLIGSEGFKNQILDQGKQYFYEFRNGEWQVISSS